MGHLEDILAQQSVSQAEKAMLRTTRDEIQHVLSGDWAIGEPRIYYGGSYAKRTMIRESYDLDIVMYFPSTTWIPAEALYYAVRDRLSQNGYRADQHNVAWRLKRGGGLHVDVVPAKAVDRSFHFANLFASEDGSTKRTSTKIHIDQVRQSGHQDVIRILKLWRLRHQLSLGSFVLETATIRALKGFASNSLSDRTSRVLEFLRDSFERTRLIDPANSNNVISGEISEGSKRAVRNAARASCSKEYWEDIVW